MKAETLIGLVVLTVAVALVMSGRPFFPASTPRIHEIAQLPDGPAMADVREYTEYGSGLLPYNRWEQAERAPKDWEAPQPVKLGYAFREVSFVGLPLWSYKEYGIVTFMDTAAGYKIALMSDEQLALLERLTGRRHSNFVFPFWRYAWGWLIVLGILAAVLLHWREQRKWREREGYI